MEGHMLQDMICRIKIIAVAGIARVSAQWVSVYLNHYINENPEISLLKVSAKDFPLICLYCLSPLGNRQSIIGEINTFC